jgi:hypothetical protein
MLPGSKDLAALPRLPKTVALHPLAGNVTLTTTLFGTGPYVVHTSSDLVVTVDSALDKAASGTGRTPAGTDEPIDCGRLDLTVDPPTPLLALSLVRKGRLPSCWHLNKPQDPEFQDRVVHALRRYLATLPAPQPSNPTTSPAQPSSPAATPTTAATAGVKTVTVPATVRWVDTGVRVEKGRGLKIQATGSWRPDQVTGPVGGDGAPQPWPTTS